MHVLNPQKAGNKDNMLNRLMADLHHKRLPNQFVEKEVRNAITDTLKFDKHFDYQSAGIAAELVETMGDPAYLPNLEQLISKRDVADKCPILVEVHFGLSKKKEWTDLLERNNDNFSKTLNAALESSNPYLKSKAFELISKKAISDISETELRAIKGTLNFGSESSESLSFTETEAAWKTSLEILKQDIKHPRILKTLQNFIAQKTIVLSNLYKPSPFPMTNKFAAQMYGLWWDLEKSTTCKTDSPTQAQERIFEIYSAPIKHPNDKVRSNAIGSLGQLVSESDVDHNRMLNQMLETRFQIEGDPKVKQDLLYVMKKTKESMRSKTSPQIEATGLQSLPLHR